MLEFDIDEYCSGCGACFNVCPKNAITMVKAEGGFLQPEIDKYKCIKCGKCIQVCTHLSNKQYRNNVNNNPNVWLYSSNDDNAKRRSSSGAAFFELAKKYIETGNHVYGCIWNDDLQAIHSKATNCEELCKMQGSKYVQSDIGNIYIQIMQSLKNGKNVLFSGTPCQAMAARSVVDSYNNGMYSGNLLTIGVLCHGVSAPDVWESYKEYINNYENDILIDVNFRDKSVEGYKKSYCKYIFKSGKITYLPTFLPVNI